MINYIEKGFGLHEAVAATGHQLVQVDGIWSSDDDAAVQAVIDGYTLDQVRAPIIGQIKGFASNKILSFLPEWKQSNLNARMNELNEARFSRALTEAENAEIEAMRATWARAKAIRAASNTHENNLKALNDFAAVLAYDWQTDWPE